MAASLAKGNLPQRLQNTVKNGRHFRGIPRYN